MSTEITFDENKYKIKSRSILGASQVPAMTRYLLSKGIVKSEKSAHGLLLGITTLFFLAAIYVFAVFVFDVNIGNSVKEVNSEDVELNRQILEDFKKRAELNTQNNNQQ